MTKNIDPRDLIRDKVTAAIIAGEERTFQILDGLHSKNIHDKDVIEALRSLHEDELLANYADWADIDLREDDNTTTNPDGVTDPGTNPSDLDMQAALAGVRETGHVNFGPTTIEFGRDRDGSLWVRPIGGVWVGVVEK